MYNYQLLCNKITEGDWEWIGYYIKCPYRAAKDRKDGLCYGKGNDLPKSDRMERCINCKYAWLNKTVAMEK